MKVRISKLRWRAAALKSAQSSSLVRMIAGPSSPVSGGRRTDIQQRPAGGNSGVRGQGGGANNANAGQRQRSNSDAPIETPNDGSRAALRSNSTTANSRSMSMPRIPSTNVQGNFVANNGRRHAMRKAISSRGTSEPFPFHVHVGRDCCAAEARCFFQPDQDERTKSMHSLEQEFMVAPEDKTKLKGCKQSIKPSLNVLGWVCNELPTDLVPEILSFLNPQKLSALSRINKCWRDIVLAEPVWQTISEETGKWKQGDSIPRSWLEYYCDNPCVPLDYSSIHSALAVANTRLGSFLKVRRSVRVLLYPGRYYARESVMVHTLGSSQVTIESLDIRHRSAYRTPNKPLKSAASCSPSLSEHDVVRGRSLSGKISPRRASRQISKKIGSFFNGCRNTSTSSADNNGCQVDRTSNPTQPSTALHAQPLQHDESLERATIVLKTRKQNIPAIRVRQGTLKLKNVNILHSCHGTDIWNGNSAVQIQPLYDDEGNPISSLTPSTPPTVIMSNCEVISFSGRGVVCIDGGSAVVRSSHVHHCAATGIYVGGQGTIATIELTDVVNNGNGNVVHPRGGIARGHSGIYLEQGVATIRDCNISNNSLTGLSAISSDNASLRLENTDLVANGTIQLEMPPEGSLSWRRSVTFNNVVSRDGNGRFRSGLVPARPHLRSSSAAARSPQSPVSDTSAAPVHFVDADIDSPH